MNVDSVLSLFNGMGCIWHALEKSSINVNTMYSSEIEKYPNQANDLIYPGTIQIGDVRNVNVSKLPPIRLVVGGSPCQSFSFAGKRKGMSAIEKHVFVFPTNQEYKDFIENESNLYVSYKDYIKIKRKEFDFYEKSRNTETIEILTLEHYLELKEQNFEFEGQSYLFWEFIRILTEIRKYNPEVKFLLENVIMGAKWQKIITQAIGINPIRINSSLVSAQNRDRLYWTNIYAESDGLFGDLKCIIPQPKDKGILLKDILEKPTDFESVEAYEKYMKKYFLSDKMLNTLLKRKENHVKNKSGFGYSIIDESEKSNCILSRYYKDGQTSLVRDPLGKSSCFTAGGNSGGLHSQMDLIVYNTMLRSSKTGKGGTGNLSWTDGKTYCLDTGNTNAIEIQCVAMRGRNPNNPKSRKAGLPTEQHLEARDDGKTICLTSVQKDNLIISGTLRTHNDGIGFREVVSGKAGTIPARAREDGSGQNVVSINQTIRRLTPRECGRLQTISEDKLDLLINSGISDTQLYKMFGNGWTVDVISYILSYMNR